MLNITIPADFTVEAHGHTLHASDLSAMPAGGIAYLIARGYSETMTNVGALTVAQKAELGTGLAAHVATKRAEKHAQILAGTVAAGGPRGPRVTGIEAMVRAVAIEWISKGRAFTDKNFRRADGTSGYKGPWADQKAAAVAAYLQVYMADESRAAKVHAEATRRMSNDTGDVEL